MATNFPQRRPTLLPREAKLRALVALSLDTGPEPTTADLATIALSLDTDPEPTTSADLATTAVQHSFIIQQHGSPAVSCEMETACHGKRHPYIATQLRRIRTDPVAQMILGNSCVAVVCLERLRLQVEPHQSLSTAAFQNQVEPDQSLSTAAFQNQVEPDQSLSMAAFQNQVEPHQSLSMAAFQNQVEPDQSLSTAAFQNQVEPDLSLSMAAFQPIVSLVRLHAPQTSKFWTTAVESSSSLDHAHQNGHKQSVEDSPEIREETSPWSPIPCLDLDRSEPTASSWTEPYNLDSPEQDEDRQLTPDTPHSLLRSGWKAISEPSELDDPQPDQDMVIEIHVDPGPELSLLLTPPGQRRCAFALDLDHESKSSCESWEMEPVCEENSEGQRMDCCSSTQHQGVVAALRQQAGAEEEETEVEAEDGFGAETELNAGVDEAAGEDRGIEAGVAAGAAETDGAAKKTCAEAAGVRGEMESEDFCGVCLDGGELLCCDGCPKVFHLDCHIPPLISFPLGNWVCTLCRAEQDDPVEMMYACENTQPKTKAPYTLSNVDQRRCEKLTLLLSCHKLSAPFHEPVSPLARNYYQTIKRPMDLSLIRKKLDQGNTLHYFTPEHFVDDVLLMFKNCATFNYPDSEVAKAGRELEKFFLRKLQEMYSEQHCFPLASQDRTERKRQWEEIL